MGVRNGSVPKRFNCHFHFVTDREQGDQVVARCGALGILPSHALRDAVTLWLRHTSESKAIRAYIKERKAALRLEPLPSASTERGGRP